MLKKILRLIIMNGIQRLRGQLVEVGLTRKEKLIPIQKSEVETLAETLPQGWLMKPLTLLGLSAPQILKVRKLVNNG